MSTLLSSMFSGNVSMKNRQSSGDRAPPESDWRASLAEAIRDPDELLARLQLPPRDAVARQRRQSFPLLVPESFLRRMQVGDPLDPLLRQVLPIEDEDRTVSGFTNDALRESDFHLAPGLLQKYQGRVLLILTGACAVNCRYCFRRHYPYSQEPKRLEDWEPAFQAIALDSSIHEVLLSGGDPLLFTDERLATVVQRLESLPQLRRLRIHTRLPIVLPNRVTGQLIHLLTSTRLTPVVVVHANHPRELVNDCADALRRLTQAGLMLLNQAVLLRGINDSADILVELSERLIDLGVRPYYLHQLDRVAGTAHFEVSEEVGRQLMETLRRRLPGYAVPQYVRETPGDFYKRPLA
jgi:EF-P beta-lysylation protein EpmB